MHRDRINSRVQGNATPNRNMTLASNGESMGKEERKMLVLQLLHNSDLVLTPAVMFRNLKLQGATFERRTLSNYLDELIEEDRVEKIDPDEPFYKITEKGRKSVHEHSE